ncbi:protein RIC-3 [Denticeps clupeoides]|nr:protein RIC-3 [Denticeps clupeoides]
MSITTFQKVTLVSCLVLCLSLFLSKLLLHRGRSDAVQRKVGPGHFPPTMQQQIPERFEQWGTEGPYSVALTSEAIARAKAKGAMGARNKSNLIGQVVPIYGVGILFYILHIFIKLTRKGKTTKQAHRLPIDPDHHMRNMTNDDLARLQSKLGNKGLKDVPTSSSTNSLEAATQRQERKLLRRMKKITQMVEEAGRAEGASPEMEAEEVPYTEDWEGYPEETYPEYDEPCLTHRYDTLVIKEPDPDIPSAEELAERMEEGHEEEEEKEKTQVEDKLHDAEEKEEEEGEEEDDEDEDDEEDQDEMEQGQEFEEVQEVEDMEQVGMEEEEERIGEEEDDNEEEEEEEEGEDHPFLPTCRDTDSRSTEWSYSGTGDTQSCRRRRITFNEHRDVFLYPPEGTSDDEEVESGDCVEEDCDDEDGDDDDDEEMAEEDEEHKDEEMMEGIEREQEDPVMEAESLSFTTEVYHDSGEEEPNEDEEVDEEEDEDDEDEDDKEVGLEEFLSTYRPEAKTHAVMAAQLDVGSLRKRHKSRGKKHVTFSNVVDSC